MGATLPARSALVVDDVPDVAAVVRDLLKRTREFDIDVTVETSGERALALVRERAFDLVLSDYELGKVSGIDVLVAARETHPSGARVLMTSYKETHKDMATIKAAHVDAYVEKPIRGHDLLLLLLGILHRDPQALAEARREARWMEDRGDE